MPAKPALLITRRLPQAVEARARRDYAARHNPADTLLGAGLVEAAAGTDALLVTPSERLDQAAIAALPASVRIIATFSVGHDHIDVAAARARGIAVTNTPDVLTDATAEVAMLLLLAAARRAHEGEAMVREGRWKSWATDLLLGRQLSGRRLGILGMGRIGRGMARRAAAFGMEIHYHNRQRLGAAAEAGAIFHADPMALLAVSSFFSLHCPSTQETRHFLDARRIAALPDGAVVVNTARGDLIEDAALIAALRSGKLFAAGLDVFAGEPALEPEYRQIENVFLLPHLGSATVEARDAMGFSALDSLDAFFAGATLANAL